MEYQMISWDRTFLRGRAFSSTSFANVKENELFWCGNHGYWTRKWSATVSVSGIGVFFQIWGMSRISRNLSDNHIILFTRLEHIPVPLHPWLLLQRNRASTCRFYDVMTVTYIMQLKLYSIINSLHGPYMYKSQVSSLFGQLWDVHSAGHSLIPARNDLHVGCCYMGNLDLYC